MSNTSTSSSDLLDELEDPKIVDTRRALSVNYKSIDYMSARQIPADARQLFNNAIVDFIDNVPCNPPISTIAHNLFRAFAIYCMGGSMAMIMTTTPVRDIVLELLVFCKLMQDALAKDQKLAPVLFCECRDFPAKMLRIPTNK